MKVEQVSFDGERISSERGPVSDVRDGIETLLAHTSAGNVNAVARDKLLIAAQVDGWNCVFGAVATPASSGRQDTERPREKMAGATYSSVNEQLANLSARNRLASQPQFRISLYLETHFATVFRQQINVTRGFVAEMEVVTFMYLAGLQTVFQNVMRKVSRRHKRKVARKREQQNCVDASRLEQTHFLGRGSEQLQRRFRPQNPHRMRLERDRHGLASLRPRAGHNVCQYRRVSAMNAVEVAHAQQGGSKAGRNVVEFMKSLHRSCGADAPRQTN